MTDREIVITALTPGNVYEIYVEARNLIGYSPVSDTLALLAAQIPDEPTDLSNVQVDTTASQIGLSWAPPLFNGGSNVIDYKIWYDNGSSGSTFDVVVENIVAANYIVTGLTKGQTYQFKVQARNIYGFSAMSNTVSILAAQIPEIPAAPTTTFDSGVVTISWTPPDNGGSEIILYSVTIQKSDGEFLATATYCDGSL